MSTEPCVEGSENRGDHSLCVGPDGYALSVILRVLSDVL